VSRYSIGYIITTLPTATPFWVGDAATPLGDGDAALPSRMVMIEIPFSLCLHFLELVDLPPSAVQNR
jgi:hypothetical protein